MTWADNPGSGQTPVGLAGLMVTASRGKAGPGEVEIAIRGGSELFIAQSEEPIDRGTPVLVVQTLGARTLFVAPWEEPV